MEELCKGNFKIEYGMNDIHIEDRDNAIMIIRITRLSDNKKIMIRVQNWDYGFGVKARALLDMLNEFDLSDDVKTLEKNIYILKSLKITSSNDEQENISTVKNINKEENVKPCKDYVPNELDSWLYHSDTNNINEDK